MSHPAWVRGLKLRRTGYKRSKHRSHPAWVRGLKQQRDLVMPTFMRSHPAWVRGLKLNRFNLSDNAISVAPCVGAWIETIRH